MEIQGYVFQRVAELPPALIRHYITGLQEQIKESSDSLPPESCPVTHTFAPGLYMREMCLPKGVLAIGKIHRESHANVISTGKVLVLTERGVQVLQAPCTFVSECGVKRVALALEDTTWTTFHVTATTDLAALEKELIAEDYSAIEIDGTFTRMENNNDLVRSRLSGSQFCRISSSGE